MDGVNLNVCEISLNDCAGAVHFLVKECDPIGPATFATFIRACNKIVKALETLNEAVEKTEPGDAWNFYSFGEPTRVKPRLVFANPSRATCELIRKDPEIELYRFKLDGPDGPEYLFCPGEAIKSEARGDGREAFADFFHAILKAPELREYASRNARTKEAADFFESVLRTWILLADVDPAGKPDLADGETGEFEEPDVETGEFEEPGELEEFVIDLDDFEPKRLEERLLEALRHKKEREAGVPEGYFGDLAPKEIDEILRFCRKKDDGGDTIPF